MTDDNSTRVILDAEHLRLLSIVYYIRAGCVAFFAIIPMVYIIMGVVMAGLFSNVDAKPGESPPRVVGWIFTAIGVIGVFVVLSFAALQFFAGRFIAQHKHRAFCLVVAALNCLGIPYGTALGVVSFMVLFRKTVAERFEAQPAR